jgi:hypothetical protein
MLGRSREAIAGLLAAAFRVLTACCFPETKIRTARHEKAVVGQAEFGYHAVRSTTTQAIRVIG